MIEGVSDNLKNQKEPPPYIHFTVKIPDRVGDWKQFQPK